MHRAAYLLPDRRIAHDGGLLFVGPHRPYLAYVSDILPNLGEEGVQVCTLADLVPEGAAAVPEADPETARLKASADLLRAVDLGCRLLRGPAGRAADGRDAVDRGDGRPR